MKQHGVCRYVGLSIAQQCQCLSGAVTLVIFMKSWISIFLSQCSVFFYIVIFVYKTFCLRHNVFPYKWFVRIYIVMPMLAVLINTGLR